MSRLSLFSWLILASTVLAQELPTSDEVTVDLPQCMDLSRDCERRSKLCQSTNNVDRNLMHQQCPKTCNTCSNFTALLSPSSTACEDLATDCEERKQLCKRTAYKRMMTKQCSYTCGFCTIDEDSSDISTERPTTLSRKQIRNKVLRGRTSLRELEENGVSLQELVSLIRSAETTTTTTSTACTDKAYDCMDKRGLCSHKSYTKIMHKLCLRTCNLCSTTTNNTETTDVLRRK